ncbi:MULTISPECIES: undecaprenyl-diphosphate phosphatase [unclassified Microcoleus]|uniref:undecaprenyl-diphosphate phosphatase n=1 Tax=unclassified Microcoleus TaxID=2642155 RepID=UPI001D2436C7|nr:MULTISPECIES: undecaprenyl-diphosphate phosphatase [unclassified Microcoleus]MCC3432252.1 undecaprenyl-diphosphate phosphatase [Microcoleus sp. PH2017_04_SCI_O_A]MCC3504279.1 undecaprenyl-diphosphate phosphatase [Microcoleus sp. PH2017_19_SFW_U_A]TAE14274.1 MAG: undecaprenyl-diphosphate phosphatase [Oscillatoriales cyanobacterium]MCC3470628.1 undecaprenyl-diphosphate phosphatase [Microcoleus sp. PH2017_13_LAR_U_A]MCC3483153.1 undecaprenyl-diphosphate phosphatase [Microcoleus sp. PH2017_14_L
MIALLDALLAQTPAADVSGPAPLNLVQTIVLGIVQGLTEFLPISSSAHLKVVPIALGWGDPGVAYTAVIQLGSIVAVLWYFWKDLTAITFGAVNAVMRRDYESQEFKMALGIGLGTIPILFFGLLIKILVPDFDKSPLRSLASIAIASIFMSLLLATAEKIGKRSRTYEKLTVQDGILMGLAQAMALIPGCSRSGSTLTAGLFMGLERGAAARFSFLLGIPAITLVGLVELKGVLGEGIGDAGVVTLAVGTISAFVFSYLSIAWLMKFLQTQNTWVFVWYRLAFGVAILTALAGGVLQNPQG